MTSRTNTRTKQDMNLVKLIDRFGNEDKCREYLEALRWPDGVRCPRCESAKVSRVHAPVGRDRADGKRPPRNQFQCESCRYQFSVRAGTVFHDSHLPLWKWFLATYMMVESKKGISANQLRRTLAVSYKTAWYLSHRIRSAMIEASPVKLTGVIEADEAYIGGKRERRGHQEGWKNKTIILGAIERGGKVRLRVDRHGMAQTTARSVESFLADVVADEAEAIYTDQSRLYQGIGDEDTRHESVDHGASEWVRGDVGTQGIESAWSLLKRSIMGSYHQLSAKHLPAYLDEFAFRFNNRENPFLFRDTLLALIKADALKYADLTGHA